MGPAEFLNIVVQPNVREMGEHYEDLRYAMNAIASVDALAAHIFHWCQRHAPEEVAGLKDDTWYREHLAQANLDFGLLRDLAKAHKHVHLNRGQPQVSSASQTSIRSVGWDEAPWDEGRWGGPPQVVVKTDKGEFRPVEAVVGNALEFLQQEMQRLGVAL